MACRILINFVHPLFEKSVANHALLEQASNLANVTVNDLYEAYPDFLIDVEVEQHLLLAHDIIVFQHPFYWYSSPSLLKEWQDLVLEAGFAYGDGGFQLAGKKMLSCLTIGAPKQSYQDGEYNQFSVDDFLKPFAQTANFCGMEYLQPFLLYDTLNSKPELLVKSGEQYKSYLKHLSDSFEQNRQER